MRDMLGSNREALMSAHVGSDWLSLAQALLTFKD